MQTHKIATTLCVAFFAVACAEIRAPSSPLIEGALSGPGSPPLKQLIGVRPHSGDASGGSASIIGGDGTGKPNIERRNLAAGSIGGAPTEVGGIALIAPRTGGGGS